MTYDGDVQSRMRWTDERLDDSFGYLRGDIGRLRGEMLELRREMRAEFHELRRWLIGIFGTIVVAMLAILIEVGIQG